MTFQKKLVSLGRGRLSSASQEGGVVTFILSLGNALMQKQMAKGGGQIYGTRIVGYCDDMWLMPGFRFERIKEELIYVPSDVE